MRFVNKSSNATRSLFRARTTGTERRARHVVKIFFSPARRYQVLRVAAVRLCVLNGVGIDCEMWRPAQMERQMVATIMIGVR